MTSDLNSTDEGVSIERRLWNLHSLVQPSFTLDVSDRTVYMLVLPEERLGGSARAFDLIDRTSSISGMYSALLQFILRTIEKVIEDYNTTNTKDNQKHRYPLHMYLETVVESEDSARAHAAKKATANVRDTVIGSFYGAETLKKRVAEPAQRTTVQSQLLRGCESRAVLYYRLWIVLDASTKFPAAMEDVLNLAIKEHARRTTATTLAVDNEALRDYKKLTGSDVSTVDFSIAKILRPDEHWAVINSRDAMLDLIAIYTGDHSLLNPEVRAEALSATDSLKSVSNPAYLGAVFRASRQFSEIDTRIDLPQSLFQNYVAASGKDLHKYTLRFPEPNRVLIVPPEVHNRKFIVRYTPKYQHFNAQNRLLQLDLQRAQKLVANVAAAPPRRSASASIVKRAVANGSLPGSAVGDDGSGANEDDDDDDNDDRHLAGGVGNDARREANERAQSAASVYTDKQCTPAERNRALIDMEMTRGSEKLTHSFTRTQHPDADAHGASIDAFVLQSRYVDPAVAAQSAKVDNAQQGHVSVTMLTRLHDTYRRERERLLTMKSAEDRAMLYTHIQKTATRDYAMSCTSAQSDISTTGKSINAFMRHAEQMHAAFFTPTRCFDTQLSVFGHMMVNEFWQLDQIYNVHTIHQLQLAMSVCHFDAYRPERALKFNVLVCSPPELGKSFGLETEERRSIPGTMTIVARRTQKSMSDGESHNDECEGSHEMARDMLMDPADSKKDSAGNGSANKGEGARDAVAHEFFKNILTSGIGITSEPHRDADGTMRERKRVSERMQTFICLTNLLPGWIADAILSRFYCEVLTLLERRDATLAEKGLDERNMTPAMQRARLRANWEYRLLQGLFYHVEKMIQTGALTEPTLSAFAVYSPVFVDTLKRYGIAVRIRSLIKMEIFVRHLVIRRSLYALYVAPFAPFRGEAVAVEHLQRIDPWLYDDSEIVFFAFEFMRSQYINTHFDVVARALRKLVEDRCATPAIFEKHRAFQTSRSKKVVGAGGVGIGMQLDAAATALETASWITVDPDDPAFDFNRLMLRTRLDALEMELASIIAATEPTKLSRQQIGYALALMEQRMVTERSYRPNHLFEGRVTRESVPVAIDPTSPERQHKMINVDRTNNIVTVHASVFGQMCDDPIAKAIEACSDRHMQRCTMLRGQPSEIDLPHILGVRTSAPNARIVHMIPNRESFLPSDVLDASPEYPDDDKRDAYAVDLMRARRQRGTLLEGVSVDDYSLNMRLDKIHLPRAAADSFSFAVLQQSICKNAAEHMTLTRDEHGAEIHYPANVAVGVSQAVEIAQYKKLFQTKSYADAVAELHGKVSFYRHAALNANELEALESCLKTFGYDVGVSPALARQRQFAERVQECEQTTQRHEVRAEADKENARFRNALGKALGTGNKRRAFDSAAAASAAETSSESWVALANQQFVDLYNSEN